MASLKSLVFGGCAGALAYLVVMPLLSPWEEAIAAALIGCVPALVRRSPRSASLGAEGIAPGTKTYLDRFILVRAFIVPETPRTSGTTDVPLYSEIGEMAA